MKNTMRRISRCLLPLTALLSSACGAESIGTEAPVGEAEEAVTTCVTIQRGTGGATDDVADALLADVNEFKNFGASESLTAGRVSPGFRKALLRFGLGAIPPGATIVSATATLHVLLYGNDGVTVDAYRVTAPWTESAVTYTSFQNAYPLTVVASFPSGSPTSADLTALVQAWVSGTVPNDGLCLARQLTGSTVFASSEIPDPSMRPSLRVCYQ